MSRAARCIALALLTDSCCRAAGAAETAVCTAVIRAVDASGGRVAAESEGAGRADFAVDEAQTLVFKGIRTLGIGDLSPGMRVEIDYRPGEGGAPPLATWIEVLESARPPAGAGDRPPGGG